MVQEFKAKKFAVNSPLAAEQPEDFVIREIMNSRIKTFNPFRRSRVPEWNINLAYLCGYQNLRFDGVNISRNSVGPFATTINKIGPAVRNDVAMGTKVPPKFDVVPVTTDEDDRQTTVAGEQMARYLRRINDFDKQRGKLIIWYDIANLAWRKQYWDPFYKVIGLNPEPEEEGHDPNLAPGAPIYQGEALSEHTPTPEVIWDWRQDIKRLPWIIHARPRTWGELLISDPEKALLIPDSEFIEPNSNLNEFEVQVFNEFNQSFGTNTGTRTKPDSSEMSKKDREVMVYEFWQVRDSNYPLGVFATMAGLEDGVVLKNQPYPIEQYPHGEVPFTGYDMMVADKSVAGTASRITQARPMQRQINTLHELIAENTAALGNGVILVNREANLNLRRMDNGPGLIIEYDGARPPRREQGQPVAGQLFLYVATLVEDLNDIFSFPQVSQGKRPVGGPKSGVGIALLQEKADTQHSPTINEMDRADERAMNQLMAIAFANYKERSFDIIGKDNEWATFELDPSSFTTKFNVYVRTGSSLPISKALERDTALSLLQMGLLGSPQDPSVKKKVLEHLDIGGLDRILKENNKDVNFAKKEFQVPVQQWQQLLEQAGGQVSAELIEQIYLPNVNPFDNHDVHIVEHKNDLLDKFFEYLGSGDPGLAVIAQAMQAHFLKHSEILAEQQIRQAIMTGEIKREDLESSQEKESAKASSSKESDDNE